MIEGPRVLVVEDEPMIKLMIEAVLEDAGYTVMTAGNEVEACGLLDRSDQPFAGLVTDIRLPEDGVGWEIARRARGINRQIAIVYVSGDSGPDWPVKGVPKSIFIQKPFTATQIVAGLSILLNEDNRVS